MLQIIFNLEKLFRENEDNVHDRQFMYQAIRKCGILPSVKNKRKQNSFDSLLQKCNPQKCVFLSFLTAFIHII